MKETTSFRDAYRDCASLDPINRALYVDARTYMIDDASRRSIE